MLKEKLETKKCFSTAWGRLITEEEAYRQLNRQIAAMTANLFQVMRIFEPNWEKRTAAICNIANMMNMAVAGSPDEQKNYVNAALYEAFNIPELCEKSSWLGGITGDSGDEWENMAGRVIQFTRNRVEKELDTCPWDIVGSELCNMTTSMFTANFDLASSNGTENEVALNMCQARGCGNKHCRVVAERRDVYGLPKQDWLEHMQQPVDPIHDTPRERMVKDGQCLRNGQYTQNFGEETSLEKAFGLMYGMREECRQYLAQGNGGVIVNICSVGATHQTSGAAYCASKGAVLAATKNTAFMYMEEGIRCNALSPGGVVTDIPLVMPPSDEFGFGRTSMLLNFSGELAMPEDLADAILFLASDQSRYVNGEELKCDGGWTCF